MRDKDGTPVVGGSERDAACLIHIEDDGIDQFARGVDGANGEVSLFVLRTFLFNLDWSFGAGVA